MRRELTEAQRIVVFDKKGFFAVRACPGSGKTFTVAARLNRLLSQWRGPHVGIAALSFTNVAWQEIQAYLSEDFGRETLHYPHFLGTIDSFINRYIFLPFGHLVMACSRRPELTGPPHDDNEPIGSWMYWRNAECASSGCLLNEFSYDESGDLVHLRPRSHFANCQLNHERCLTLKQKFTTLGYATQADANYFAMKILREYPEVAAAISHRFPVVMVDEAQDTSRIQMNILDSLIDAGLSELMLVGDPFQAIYEWRHAEPSLFLNKIEAWRHNATHLKENWRSTQSICDLADRLSCSSERMVARNSEVIDYDHAPCLYGYSSDDELPGILDGFKKHCGSLGIRPESISVLSRSEAFVNAVVPGSPAQRGIIPWRDGDLLTPQVAHAKYLFDRGFFRDGLRILEVTAYKHLTGCKVCRMEDVTAFGKSRGLGKWRGQLFSLLAQLPKSEGTISAWVKQAETIATLFPVLMAGSLSIKRDLRSYNYSSLTFPDLFQSPAPTGNSEFAIGGTVHSVKGKSLEAVFLALKSKGATGRYYVNLLSSDLLEEEEMRIVYVAVSRARKALGIAVPKAALENWRRFLFPQDVPAETTV